jgi:hypothetical protein
MLVAISVAALATSSLRMIQRKGAASPHSRATEGARYGCHRRAHGIIVALSHQNERSPADAVEDVRVHRKVSLFCYVFDESAPQAVCRSLGCDDSNDSNPAHV